MSPELDGTEKPLQQHRQLVARGLFDAIPQSELTVGQPVATRHNDKFYLVLDVDKETGMAIVGYDREEEEVRLALPIEDIRDAEGYSNAVVKFLGLGKEIQLTIRKKGDKGGIIVEAWSKARQN